MSTNGELTDPDADAERGNQVIRIMFVLALGLVVFFAGFTCGADRMAHEMRSRQPAGGSK